MAARVKSLLAKESITYKRARLELHVHLYACRKVLDLRSRANEIA